MASKCVMYCPAVCALKCSLHSANCQELSKELWILEDLEIDRILYQFVSDAPH